MVRTLCWSAGLLLLAWVGLNPAAGQQKKAAGKVLQGADAVRQLLSQGNFAKAEEHANHTLFPNIHQPEVLELLIRALEGQKKREEAAVMATWLLRVLETATPAEVAKYKSATEKKLAPWNKEFEQQKARYAAAAADKKFDAPEKVDDLWMTHVRADLTSPHALYAYNLIGGRKYSEIEHATIAGQGVMHRSGLRHVPEVAGRKGVLFGVPMRADGNAKQKLGHPPQVRLHNVGKGTVLRVGTKGFGFPYLLKVSIAGKEVLAQTISEKQWSDLKIDLGEHAGKPVEAVLELVIPDGQKFSEGVWLDYLDFFAN
jgi:hypothetical protein